MNENKRTKKRFKTIDFKKTKSRGISALIKKSNIPAPAFYQPKFTQVFPQNKTLVNYNKTRVVPGKRFYLQLG
jgi:hypothetical protein